MKFKKPTSEREFIKKGRKNPKIQLVVYVGGSTILQELEKLAEQTDRSMSVVARFLLRFALSQNEKVKNMKFKKLTKTKDFINDEQINSKPQLIIYVGKSSIVQELENLAEKTDKSLSVVVRNLLRFALDENEKNREITKLLNLTR